jgi:putative endonuclease
MGDKIKRGRQGEERAAAFLQQKGYEIVARNFRHGRSEIDLIARKDQWLIFVEVKTRTSVAFGYPEESVNSRKASKILEGAEHYIFESNWHGPVRYDVVAITYKNGNEEIVHLEDAFY